MVLLREGAVSHPGPDVELLGDTSARFFRALRKGDVNGLYLFQQEHERSLPFRGRGPDQVRLCSHFILMMSDLGKPHTIQKAAGKIMETEWTLQPPGEKDDMTSRQKLADALMPAVEKESSASALADFYCRLRGSLGDTASERVASMDTILMIAASKRTF